jgi:hypothetical protein
VRKSKKVTKQTYSDFEALQGGILPANLVRRQLADVQRKLSAEFEEENALRLQGTTLYNQVAPPVYNGETAETEKTLDGLRRFTERLAKRKLAVAPKIRLPPDVWGRYSLRFTPPYTGLGGVAAGQLGPVTGSPTLSATGVDSLGQMTCSVDTNFDKPSSGTAANLMGVHFKPLFKNATARISFDSQLAFSFYMNSIRDKIATARGQGLIQLFQFDSAFVQPALQRGAFIGFNQIAENELDFDIHSDAGPTWSLQAPVSSDHFYFVVISLSCSASGAGWPGSLAGSKVSVTVPSITVTITGEPLLQL